MVVALAGKKSKMVFGSLYLRCLIPLTEANVFLTLWLKSGEFNHQKSEEEYLGLLFCPSKAWNCDLNIAVSSFYRKCLQLSSDKNLVWSFSTYWWIDFLSAPKATGPEITFMIFKKSPANWEAKFLD